MSYFPFQFGSSGCQGGVFVTTIANDDMTMEFPQIGIQCTKKKEIEANLEKRKNIRVDPFRQEVILSEIDLNAVKLCFQVNCEVFNLYIYDDFLQVFLEPVPEPGFTGKSSFTTTLAPICSNPIFNKHAENLKIVDISDNQDTVAGNKKIIILTEKLPKPEDIAVRFSDPVSGWEARGYFEAGHVHKQVAITLKVPKYENQNLKEQKKVTIELIKLSDGNSSDPIAVFYTPIHVKGGIFFVFKQLF
jgi:c-Rel proto-oncogene protein